jgi:hypothetical protein
VQLAETDNSSSDQNLTSKNASAVLLSRYSKKSNNEREIADVSKLEYFLLFWIVSLLIEEFRQVRQEFRPFILSYLLIKWS